ncbi:MAG: hypothetical protein ACLFUJ_15775, partial [Phycisphaerae bacterium]
MRYALLLPILAALLVGCGPEPTMPAMELRPAEASPDPAAAIAVPRDTFLTDEQVSEAITRAHRSLPPDGSQWQAIPTDRLDPAGAAELGVVQYDLPEKPSPYQRGRYPVVYRVLVRMDDGRLFFTAPLSGGIITSAGSKYLRPAQLAFDSPHGTFEQTGVLHTQPISPLLVAVEGYRATVALKGSSLAEQMVLPPGFEGLGRLYFDGPEGLDGLRGSSGSDGRAGSDGSDGDWAGISSYPRRGSDGADGWAGRSGDDGGPGGDGGDGRAAGRLTIQAEPLQSNFYDKPLVKLVFTHSLAAKPVLVVLPQEKSLGVYARGGSGGSGGPGGSGASGGPGGRGGSGGAGSRGTKGHPGRDGDPGRDGRDATMHSEATRGGSGGPGGSGGDGADGGPGGHGGDGGRGGSGGSGGSGGDGGHGGSGAEVLVRIEGPGGFVDSLRQSLSV